MTTPAIAPINPPWMTSMGLANRSSASMRQTVRPGCVLSIQVIPSVTSQFGGIWRCLRPMAMSFVSGDDAGLAELPDLFLAQAPVGQSVVCALTRARRRPPDCPGRSGEPRRRGGLDDSGDLDEGLAMGVVRMR